MIVTDTGETQDGPLLAHRAGDQLTVCSWQWENLEEYVSGRERRIKPTVRNTDASLCRWAALMEKAHETGFQKSIWTLIEFLKTREHTI